MYIKSTDSSKHSKGDETIKKIFRDLHCHLYDAEKNKIFNYDLRFANIRSISASSSCLCRRFDTPVAPAGTRGAIAI